MITTQPDLTRKTAEVDSYSHGNMFETILSSQQEMKRPSTNNFDGEEKKNKLAHIGEQEQMNQEEVQNHLTLSHLSLDEIKAMFQRLADIEVEAENLLSDIDSSSALNKIASELLELLEAWSTVHSKLQNHGANMSDANAETLTDDTLTNLIGVIQEKLYQEDMSHQEKVFLGEWLDKLSHHANSSYQGNLLSLVQNFETELTQLMQAPSSHQSSLSELQEALAKILKKLESKDHFQPIERRSENQPITKEKTLFRDLAQIYQKRKGLEMTYRTYAEVESKDVAKWLSHVLENRTPSQNGVPQTGTGHTTMPISKVEQYMLHINQSQNQLPVEQKMTDELQKIIQNSKFLLEPQGRMQLSISLRPDNLGDMMIRFVQMDGEMTVKIIVNSMQTKEMLEKNSHQLRHLFSPHQIVIEKQDLNGPSANDMQPNQDEKNPDEDQQHEEQSNQRDGQQQDGDFESYFEDLLMNEKA